MDTHSVSNSTSPSLNGLYLHAEGTSDNLAASISIGTPGTDASILFDDVSVEALDSLGEDGAYILVVGGLGYIGSHTTLELLKAGYDVVVVDNLSNAYRDVLDRVEFLAAEHCLKENKTMPRLRFHEADYKSPAMRSILSHYASKRGRDGESSPPSISQIKGVIHFAAYKAVEESINDPIPYYLNNVCGMVGFLALLREFGIMNFVFSSSATVYGSKANLGVPLVEENCVHEDTTILDANGVQSIVQGGVSGLTSPYGRTKWMCEAILADVAKSDPRWKITALRYFNPVGCHESGLLGEDPRQIPTNLVPVVIRVLTGVNPTLNIFGTDWDTEDGTAVRDFIHVTDLARGHIAALNAAAQGKTQHAFRAYNLGTGTGHSVRAIIDSIEKASKQKVPVKEVGRRPGDVGSCVAGVDRASSELGWKTIKSLDDCTTDIWTFTSRNQLITPSIDILKQPTASVSNVMVDLETTLVA